MRAFPYKDLKEFKIFKKLNTPQKVQDFLDTFPVNHEIGGETYRSPLYTLKHKTAHCMEGAMLAAAIFWYHGYEPLLMDFKTSSDDVGGDHVVAIFKRNGLWGAISKTNHNVLRYRDPIYKNLRELAMSYFNEYFTDKKKKSLREYSGAFSLLKYPDTWVIDEKYAWDIVKDIDECPHQLTVPKNLIKILRPVDEIEYKNSIPVEWPRVKNSKVTKNKV